MDYLDKFHPVNNYDNIKIFFRNSVVSIPIITFMIGYSLQDYYLIFLVLGLFLTGIINFTIKKLLKSFNTDIFLRPKNAKGCSACGGELPAHHKVGFPSGHSQLIWFFAIYLILYSNTLFSKNWNSLILLPLALMISISRLDWIPQIGQPCHTFIQVVSGGLLGILSAYLYFYYISFIIKKKLFPN